MPSSALWRSKRGLNSHLASSDASARLKRRVGGGGEKTLGVVGVRRVDIGRGGGWGGVVGQFSLILAFNVLSTENVGRRAENIKMNEPGRQ